MNAAITPKSTKRGAKRNKYFYDNRNDANMKSSGGMEGEKGDAGVGQGGRGEEAEKERLRSSQFITSGS